MNAPDFEPENGEPADRSGRLWALFDQAADLPPPDQRALLDAACADDPELRAAVDRLLADDARLGAAEGAAFLESPLIRAPAGTPAAAPSGAAGEPRPVRLGRYRLIRLLGEGGMGAVYEAEQDNPRRTVALKVVRPGPASDLLLERFRHESQFLGRLHHPGIAQVYEAGLADDGQPFFAMEFIRGLPLDEYARAHGLTLPACLELLARVCDAVQHANDRGVVHRDLKPANILVGEAGHPKVFDFGVARATDEDLFTGAGLTRTGQLLGTPNYMSPEQVSGDSAGIDQRADVYALGVILFELAAHRLPYRLENRPMAEAARIVLEEDPPRLGSFAAELRGDVETIVAKALEKDRTRRYGSAADLAADIRSWLAHEPIRARPPSALYHLRKFARRHRGLVGGAAATGLALVLGTVFSLLFAFGEARQRREADQNARAAEGSARDADQAHRAALRETYQARLTAAVMSLRESNYGEAGRQLDAAPADLRGWEWQHLHARVLDLSPVIAQARPDFDSLFGYFPPGGGLLARKGNRYLLVDLRTHALRRDVCDGVSFRGIVQTPTGPLLAYARPGGGMTLLDESGAESQIPVGWDGQTVVATGDRKLIAAWNRESPVDGRLRLFELPSGRVRMTIEKPQPLRCAALSPDGTHLAGGAEQEREVYLWDTATGARTLLHGHTAVVLCVAFHPDGKRLVSGAADNTIRQWDVGTAECTDVRHGHSNAIVGVTYSPDGQWIASSSEDRTVRIWKTNDPEPPTVLHDHATAVFESFFSADGLTLSTRGEPQEPWRVWPTPAASDRVVLRGHSKYVYPVVHSPDGRLLASAGWDDDYGVRLWDAASGTLVAVLKGHTHPIFSLAFSPDSRRLVSRSDDATLRVWDAETGAVVAVLRCDNVPDRGSPQSVVVTPDGRTIVTGTMDGVRCWDLGTGKELARVPLPLREVRIIALRQQDGLLAASGAGPDIVLFDLKSRQVRKVLRHPTAPSEFVTNSLAFSPDGRQLLSAGRTRDLQLWDVESGKFVRELPGHTGDVFAAIFHPDGRRIVSAGRDRSIRVWDPARGEELVQLMGHSSYVFSLSFSPDGSTLASGSGDGTVRLWESERLTRRLDARREEEEARPEAERLVERLFREESAADRVAERLRTEARLTTAAQRAARAALLRHQKLSPP
jgi:eukaryotic-like serine/threonine-protein kinase